MEQVIDPVASAQSLQILSSCGWSQEILQHYTLADEQIMLMLRTITKQYGSYTILSNINLQLKQGDIIGIVGPTASGKTTLLNIISCITKPSHGNVWINDQNTFVHLTEDHVASSIGYSTQHPSCYADLTLMDNLQHYLNLYGRINEIDHIITIFNLKQFLDMPISELSIGLQKKIDIALATAHHPQILLLDDPFTECDTNSRKELWDILHVLNKGGVSILITTKNIQDLTDHCTQILTLNSGMLVPPPKSWPTIILTTKERSYIKEPLKIGVIQDEKFVVKSQNTVETTKLLMEFFEKRNDPVTSILITP
ncbi:MAG: ABC transporter ATP-binding protein [Nanoarchaeota archaeon]